jgi:hypothetical protein
LLQPGEGGIGIFRSAGSDVGNAAQRVIEQHATGRVGQHDEFRTALFEWHNILGVSRHVQLPALQPFAHFSEIVS